MIWDHDGTLVDSLPKHHAALAKVFKTMGIKIPPLSTMCQWWYMPAGERFKALGVHLPEEEIWPIYDQVIGDRIFPVFPGVKETLAGLKRRNLPSVVVTASPYPGQVFRCLAELVPFIHDIHCDKENKVSSLVGITESLGLRLGEVVYVGDMISDARDAKAAGVRFVGFDAGYGGREVLCEEGAEEVIETHTELFTLIDDLD